MKSSPICIHHLAPPERAVWVPGGREQEGVLQPLVKRRYCLLCGKIHYTGAHRGRKLSFWIDYLSRFSRVMNHLYRREHKISRPMTDVQRRRIQMEMECLEVFQDLFSVTFSQQQERFERLVKNHTGIRRRELELIYERLLSR